MKKVIVLSFVVLMTASASFATYIVVLTNGNRYRATEHWTISGGKAIIHKEDGTTLQLDPTLIDVAKTGIPATERFLNDTRPLLRQLDPFLRDVNPILRWLGIYKREIAAFFANDSSATQGVDRPPGANGQPVHYLRTANPLNPENLAAYPTRIATNRSNP